MEKEKIISVMKRYELKYYLNESQLSYFINEISKYMKVDKYGLTTISSLYYDTPSYHLINIFLDNSVKYTGGDNKSSYFVISESKGKIEFRFSNTIDKNDEVDAKQILERFYRSPSNKKEGSGVGLSIANEIVKLHKGNIKVDKTNNTLSFIITFNS